MDAKAQVGAGGLGCEPASAASVAGAKRLREEGVIAASDRVVCILTGHQLKDPTATVAYHGTDEDFFAKTLAVAASRARPSPTVPSSSPTIWRRSFRRSRFDSTIVDSTRPRSHVMQEGEDASEGHVAERAEVSMLRQPRARCRGRGQTREEPRQRPVFGERPMILRAH